MASSDTCGAPQGAASLRTLVHWLEIVLGVAILSQAARWTIWSVLAGRPFDRDFLQALPVSLRFDVTAAGWLGTPVLLCFLAAPMLSEGKAAKAASFAQGWRTFSLLLCAWLGIVDFGFFNEYRDQFNPWIFGAFEDDGVAVVKTFFSSYHWFRYLLVFALSAVAVWLFARADPFARVVRSDALAPLRTRIATYVAIPLLAVLAIGCYRGGFGRRPAQIKDAYVCRNDTANRLVPNHLYLLRHAVVERLESADAKRAPAFAKDIRRQAAIVYGPGAEKARCVSELLMQKARGSDLPPPRRVYLFVMESYDRWPMTPPYDAIGLADGLRRLEAMGAGASEFVSGSYGTMPSLGAITTGLPPCDVPQNYQQLARNPFPTSIAPIFKKLGYKTRMVYGGFGGWQRIADFMREQGFDEIVTGSQIPCDESDKGEWGAPDGFLFRHLARLADTDTEPTFTLVMSTSYHPPYLLDLKKYGCADAVMPAALKANYDGENSLRVFSHLKYADAELAGTVASITAKHPDSLFGITGDHWSRKFLNASPSLSERKSVPFVVYGPRYVPAGTRLAAGVHMDMVPTLLRFCAPAGFTYPAFGRDLFEKTDRPGALGNGVVVHAKGLYLADNPAEFSGEKPAGEEAARGIEFTNAQKALSWWALMRGEELPPLAK